MSYPGPDRRRIRQPLFPVEGYAAAMRATAIVCIVIGIVIGLLIARHG